MASPRPRARSRRGRQAAPRSRRGRQAAPRSRRGRRAAPRQVPPAYLSGREAARLLGIKRETLWAYASRGLVRSIPDREARGHQRRYARDDLERLEARRDARAGHAPVAAAALRWGEPVLETAVGGIDAAGPIYRGHAAVALAEAGRSFESVAELLWTGTVVDAPTWPPAATIAGLGRLLPRPCPAPARLAVATTLLGARDAGRFQPGAELDRARRLVTTLAGCARGGGRAPAGRGVAARLLASLGRRASDEARRAVDAALVLCADHELNPSSFAARIAASAGADLYACVAAGLATLSGPRHGGMCDRVEALLAEIGAPRRVAVVVRERWRRGEAVPGFGHPLYPRGDPRARVLLALADELAPRRAGVRAARILAKLGADAGEPPTVDLGLCALSAALGLPAGSAVAIFAVGRLAGYVAHALEQRAAGFVLRPRARYIGPAPG